MNTLIIPAGIRSNAEMPWPLLTNRMGQLNCVRAAKQVLENNQFDKVYFIVIKNDEETYDLKTRILYQCKDIKNVDVIILDNYTSSEPQTVYEAIIKNKIEGYIFIKDAISLFKTDVIYDNSVYTCKLEETGKIIPSSLSYVKVDELNTVNTICEKKVISNQFCAGGYGFKDAREFCNYYLKWNEKCKNNFYISHIIFDMILHDNLFEAQHVKNLIMMKE